MASALGVVLALVLGLLALLRSRFGRRFLIQDGSSLIRVVGSGAIAPRKHVVLVAVGGEVLIVGTTPTEMVSLGRITDPAQVSTLLEKAAERPVPLGLFGMAVAGHEDKHVG
ncbi:MAG: flagellar biosynthetic protein FliO [Nitrospiraceae bacterium]